MSNVMKSLKLPKDLQSEILKYYQYINETPDTFQDLERFFAALSPSLVAEIRMHMNKELISKIDFMNTEFQDVEISFLISCFKLELYLPTDCIIRQGEDADRMYFLNKGTVDVFITKYDFVK